MRKKLNGRVLAGLVILSMVLLVALLGCGPWAARLWQRVTAKIKAAPSAAVQCVAVAAVLLLSTAYLVDSTYNPFLYFRF